MAIVTDLGVNRKSGIKMHISESQEKPGKLQNPTADSGFLLFLIVNWIFLFYFNQCNNMYINSYQQDFTSSSI